MRKASLLILSFTFCFFSTHAGIFISINSGDWNDPNTWDVISGSSTIPGAGDEVFIQAGTIVTVTQNAAARNVSFLEDGAPATLIINPGITLSVSNTLTMTVPDSDVQNTLDIGEGTLNIQKDLEIISNENSDGQSLISLSNGNLSVKRDILVSNDGNSPITIDQSAGSNSITLSGSFENSDQVILNGGNSSTFTYNGNNQVVGGGANITYGNLELLNNGKTLNGPVSINANLTLGTGVTLDQDIYNITGSNSGIFTMNSGSELIVGNTASTENTLFPSGFIRENINFAPNTLVTYASSAAEQIIATAPVYGTLSLDGAPVSPPAVKSLDGDSLFISNDLVFESSDVRLDIEDNVVKVENDITGQNATIDLGTGELCIGGDFNSGSVLSPNTGSIRYIGTGSQSIRPLTYFNLTIDNPGGTAAIPNGQTVIVNNLLTLSEDAGILTTQSTGILTGTGDMLINGGRLEISTSGLIPDFSGTRNFNGGTLVLNGTGNQTLRTGSYANIEMTVNGTKNTNGPLDINGDLLIGSNTTFDPQENTVSLSGDWTNNGIFTEDNSSVIFDGDQLQTLSASIPESFFNWIINNTSTGDAVSLNSDVIVNNDLDLQNGIINTNGNRIQLSNNATQNFSPPISGNRFIKGELIQTVATTDPVTLLYPLGGDGEMQMISFSFTQVSATSTQYMAEYVESSAQKLGLTLPPQVDKVSNVGFWRIDNTGTGFQSASVTIDYGNSQEVTDPSELRLVKSDGSGNWQLITTGTGDGQGSGEPSGQITSNINFTSLSEFALANAVGGDNPLPVSLTNFEANLNTENHVEIQWQTVSEMNSESFLVERSTDGQNFETLISIAAAGNSTRKIDYSFTDVAPPSGLIYYRLRQIDHDGTFEFFGPISIHFNGIENLTKVYPNPAVLNEGFQIKLEGYLANETFLITVYDSKGHQYLEKAIETDSNGNIIHRVTFANNLNSGVYFLHIRNNKHFQKHKILLTK